MKTNYGHSDRYGNETSIILSEKNIEQGWWLRAVVGFTYWNIQMISPEDKVIMTVDVPGLWHLTEQEFKDWGKDQGFAAKQIDGI